MAAFSPLTTWLESSSSSMLWGEIHGGGLGDGGRACGWDWIFGPILNDAEVHIAVRASAEPLRTGQLGTGHASISIQAQGALRYDSDGRFPVIAWLEQEGAARIFPISQGGGLGDGGFHCWTDWVFGNPVSLEGESEIEIRVALSATLHLGIAPNADMEISVDLQGNLLTNDAIWDPNYRSEYVGLEDSYLTAILPIQTYLGVRCRKSHTRGKYYFEFKSRTTPYSSYFAIGIAQADIDIREDSRVSGTWWWASNQLYENYNTNFTWASHYVGGDDTHGIAIDLDNGKIWFYSGYDDTWYNSGDPETGANPTFSNVSGTVYPIVNGYNDLDRNVPVTANFGATAFVHTIPSGFEAWNATEPLVGDCPVTLSPSGTLTVSRTLLGLANSTLSIAASGTLTATASLVFSGNLAITMGTAGALTTPRTLLGTANTDIALTPAGTLTQQTAVLIAAQLTVLAQGDLSGTRMMIGNTTISLALGGTLGYEILHATVALAVPAPILIVKAHDKDNAQIALTLPAPTLTAETGARCPLTLPAPVLTVVATSLGYATAALELSAPELTATAITGHVAEVFINLPAPTLQATTGAYASLAVLAPTLTATGSVDHLARITLTLPFIELTATGRTGAVATLALELPEPELEASGSVGGVSNIVLTLPALVFHSVARYTAPTASLPPAPPPGTVYQPGPTATTTTVVLATESTYAVNLNSGAVTQLLLGSFDKLVTAHGRLYGLRAGELVYLEGETDDGELIPATVRFAPQTFGTNRAKRMSDVYLSTRENDGLTLTVVADEATEWRYQTPTDTAAAFGTHKVKVGRGVKFHTAGLIVQNRNGGKLDIGGMELLIDAGSPRPRS